jgi:hypothetical protein
MDLEAGRNRCSECHREVDEFTLIHEKWATGRTAATNCSPSARRALNATSLPPGISQEGEVAISAGMSSATARLVEIAPARSARLLADLEQFDGRGGDDRPSVFDRLAAALGQELAERIVRALSAEALDRLDAALSPAFAERLAAALANEIDEAA